jgi:threonyl-tRNA synthetase
VRYCLLEIFPEVSSESVKESDFQPLQEGANKAMKEKQSFDRLWVSKLNLEKMFGYSKYKMHYINALLPEDGSTVYRCGTLVDLCRGPHIQNTNKIKAFKIMKACAILQIMM